MSMISLSKSLLSLWLLALLVACAGGPERSASAVSDEGTAVEKPVELPFKAPPPPLNELNEDVVFNTLVGEIAVQRGKLDLAYRYELQSALLAGDAEAAERATRIAIVLKRPDLALKAAQHWVELAPNELQARQVVIALYMQGEREQEALRQMEAVLTIGRAKGEDGYLHAMSALSKSKDHGLALSLMKEVTAPYADDPRAGYAVALMALMWRDFPTAEDEIAGVLERHPDWTRGYVLQSRIYQARGDRAAARRALQEALDRMPDDLLLNEALARLLVEDEAYEQAYGQFQKVERLRPEDADVQYSLGVLAMQLERPEDARGYFRRLQQMGKHRNGVAYYLGRIEQQQGRSDQAVQWYKKVASGEFRYDSQVRIAQTLAEAGRLHAAWDWFQGLRIQMPEKSVQLFLLEADLVQKYGTPDQVMALYDKALQAHQGSEDLLYARGLYAVGIDRLDLLERDMRAIIAQNPGSVDALNALGYTLADKTGRLQEALALIDRALTLKPDSSAVLDSMGWVQYRLGNFARAATYLRKALALQPDPEIAAHLGEVLWVLGEKEQARQVWKQALQRDPESEYIKEVMQRLTP
jgi:tetratricopeptide (TPR) repeat protein